MGTFGQTLSWALLATTDEARKVARVLPRMINPVNLDSEKMDLICQLEDTTLPTIQGVATPDEMIRVLLKKFNNINIVKAGDSVFRISPWLANKIGNLGGGEIQLYAETLCQLYPLLTVPLTERTDEWKQHLGQWYRGHRGALEAILQGEIYSENNVGFVKKALRGKGVYTGKIGAWSAKWESAKLTLPNGGVQESYLTMVQPGYMYISSNSPLTHLQGKHIIRWRNPMVFLEMSQVIVVGDKTERASAPDVYTPGRTPLPTEKVFFHPLSVSKTAGDVDGDGIQFFCVEELVDWCLKNHEVAKSYPGLWAGLMEHFVDLDPVG